MTSLLSSISGQFGKAVILGSLFPVLILSILNVLLVAPLLPATTVIQTTLKNVALGEEKWVAVTLVFLVLVLTGLLYNLNIPIIRLYEGYPWQSSWIGWLFIWPKKKAFAAARDVRLSLRYLRRQDPENPQMASLEEPQTALGRYLNAGLPDREDLILPTRLGNVIRCFERYPWVAYGMEAIVLWPRLIAKINPSFSSTIDDAKTSFDFMLNCSFLSAVTAAGIVTIGLAYPVPLTAASTVPWVWRALVFAMLAFVFYRFSIGRAAAWGMQVRAAFDLYREDLLKALGYQQQPQTVFEEKALWQPISTQLLYPDTRPRPVPYRASTTRVVASPAGIQLEISKELQLIALDGRIDVWLTVRNDDRRAAEKVLLVETLPEGYRYVLQSARWSGGEIPVSSLSPLEMAVPAIAAGTTLEVVYTIQRAGQ